MIKKILLILITGIIILSLNNPINAEINAGHSATLSSFLINNQIKQSFDNFFIKEQTIRSVLKKYQSPLVDEAKNFVIYANKYQLEPYLLPSIAGLESTFGRFILHNSFNPFGWGGGYIIFQNWEEAINTVSKGLRYYYINKGADNIYSIGKIYSESPTWITRVNWFINQFKLEEENIILYYSNFQVKL